MINLKNTTFIIPVFIESIDRLNNCITVLSYLNYHFNTNVIIHEMYDKESKLNFLKKFKNLNIKHIKEKNTTGHYHRTRQLNEMLSMVETDVVCNYDIDVVLPINTYIISEYLLKNSIFDVVYPYGDGFYQVQVPQSISKDEFDVNFSIDELTGDKEKAEFGHCQFFKTDIYKGIGGENENFISYGPEDKERFLRCLKFNLKIHRIYDFVYHFEHSRSFNSNENNSYFQKNKELCEKIEKMNYDQFIQYYNGLDYIKKYNFTLLEEFEDKSEKKSINSDSNIIFNQPIPNIQQNRQNFCLCGQPKDTVRYNYCQKCNRLY
jgi:hypothetical protein